MIALETLEGMFADIAARTPWDMSRPMLWGYFFTDPSTARLEAAAGVLEIQGYRFVQVFAAEQDPGEEQYFFLHVEKEEVHSPQSLHQRNGELYAFASAHGLRTYDGMDVGPIQRA